MLVEIQEKTREALKAERAKRKTITKAYDNFAEQRSKLLDELENHKQAVKAATDEIEKLKNDQGNRLQGASAVELPRGKLLEDVTRSYLEAVENFELAAQPTRDEHGGLRAAYSSAICTLRSTVALGASCSAMEEKEKQSSCEG